MVDIRCGNCKETFEIESADYSADYDCPHCGRNVKFTTELDKWVKKIYSGEINYDFLLQKKVTNNRLVSVIMSSTFILFGSFSLLAWMFIITIPIGIWCIKVGLGELFSESITVETFCVFDKSNSRIVLFVHENGELVESSETKIKVEPRCKIVSYSWWSGGHDTGSAVTKVFITQKDNPINFITNCPGEFAKYLGIDFVFKGYYDHKEAIPENSHEWLEW